MVHPISLLLIESDAPLAQAVVRMLAVQRPHWSVHEAQTVAQGRQVLAQQAFDVVLLSDRLADGRGFDLQEDLADTPVILCVEEGGEVAAAQGMRQGFSDYLIKDSRSGYLLTLPLQVAAANERRTVARALARQQQRLELAMDGSGVMVWERHVSSGKVGADRRWLEWLGYEVGEAPRNTSEWQCLIHPDDWPVVQAANADYLAARVPRYECEYRLRRKDGTWVWTLSRGHAVERDAAGEPVRLVGTFMDITERKAQEQVLARQHQMLQAISRTQSKFIDSIGTPEAFEGVLADLLALTGSGYGFVGEVLLDPQKQPFIRTHAMTDISWDEPSRAFFARSAMGGLEFHNLKTLFGAALVTEQPVISNDPANDPRRGGLPPGHPPMLSFLGIPIHHGNAMVAMVGLANRPGGYGQADLDDLRPLCHTIGQLVQARRIELARRQAVSALHTTLNNISQGIVAMDAETNITLYNQHFLTLLDLPESLITSGITGAELAVFQANRGDFGDNFDYVEPRARPFLQAGVITEAPERFLRRTHAGLTLEIKTQPLPGGGIVRTFSDVTYFVEAQQALLESETRFRSLTELSSDWYWEQDDQFRFVRIDGNLNEFNGMASQSHVGFRRWETDAVGVSEAGWEAHRQVLLAHKTFRNFELQRMGLDGRMNWVSVSGVPIFDAQGKFQGYRGIGRNITEQKRVEDETQRLAFYDTLTGLPNRRLLLDRLALALINSARTQRHGALLFIDLDNFKDLNDTLGHDIGDQLLEKVGNRLSTCIREGDTVARLGGDEFVVMLEDLDPAVERALAQTEMVGDKVLAALNRPYDLPGREHYSTPSVGVTLFCGREPGVDELLKRADLAMYQAKAAGRNTLRFFDPNMQAAVANRAALELDLRRGLQTGELQLHYQGVVNAQGQLVGAEALARWLHPSRGMVSPVEFIGLAEQTGLILPLGAWVLRAASEQLVVWASEPATAHLTLAVNVSARQFRQPDFVEGVLATLAQTGARADRLKLELTESMLLHDVEDTIAKMVALKGQGVGFSLDDFGTGYSSLSYLKRLPLDQLKIDRSFVRDVLTDPDDAAIARAVITLAHSLGLAVVAEGVEQPGQLAFLIGHGCQTFQGFLFGKPVPAAQLLAVSSAMRPGMAAEYQI